MFNVSLSLCDTCIHCQLCGTVRHEAVQHSCLLIYVSTIKRHGLYRSAVTFLYSHRHSWRTAGWSGKRFMALTLAGSLKLWQAMLPPLFLSLSLPCSPSLPPSVVQPKHREEGDRPANQLPPPKQSVISHLPQSVQLQQIARDNESMDTTDTLWLFVAGWFHLKGNLFQTPEVESRHVQSNFCDFYHPKYK